MDLQTILVLAGSASVSAGAYLFGFRKGARWVLKQWKEELYDDGK